MNLPFRRVVGFSLFEGEHQNSFLHTWADQNVKEYIVGKLAHLTGRQEVGDAYSANQQTMQAT